MKKSISLLLVMLICFSAFSFSSGAYSKTGRYMCSANALNLRAEPVNGTSLGTLKYGDEIEVTQIENGWAKTKWNGKTVWCSMRYLVYLDGELYQSSQAGVDLIKGFEGFYEFAYWDYSQWTIGYGTKCEENEYPNGITREEAEVLLQNEMLRFEMQLNAFLGYFDIDITQNQFDALVSLTFNIGSGWLNDSYLSTYLKNGVDNYTREEVISAFGQYVHAGGEVISGLVARRNKEAALFVSDMPEHIHRYTDKTVTDPTCTSDGSIIYACSCGDYYEEVLFPTDHRLSDYMVIKEPTRNEKGLKIKRCVMCGEELLAEEIPCIMGDVAENSWYYEGVKHCVTWGYISGNEKGEFMPNDKLTREQFVTILARFSGDEIGKTQKSSFNDVKSGSWYINEVEWAAKQGYVKGVGNGENFGVGQNLSRQELCVMLYRYFEKNGGNVEITADISAYTDNAKIATWAQKESAWAVAAGLISSTDTEKPVFSPEMAVTRAQAAKIFMSFDNLKY